MILLRLDCADLEWTDYMAVLDDRELLVIRDRFTGIIEAFPLKGKATEEIVLSIKRFIGSREGHFSIFRSSTTVRESVQRIEDPTRHFSTWKECYQLPCREEYPIPCRSHGEAGLPACYWTFAVTCCSHLCISPTEH